jgi:hypothetical protein
MADNLFDGVHVPIYILLEKRILRLEMEDNLILVNDTHYHSLSELIDSYQPRCERCDEFNKPYKKAYPVYSAESRLSEVIDDIIPNEIEKQKSFFGLLPVMFYVLAAGESEPTEFKYNGLKRELLAELGEACSHYNGKLSNLRFGENGKAFAYCKKSSQKLIAKEIEQEISKEA